VYPSKHIVYFGADLEFYKEIGLFIQDNCVGDFRHEQFEYRRGALVDSYKLGHPAIVIMDFTTIKDVQTLLDEVIYLKRSNYLKNVLLVGVFENSQSLSDHKILLTSGFQLFHIKGTEIQTVLRDSCYIAFNDNFDFPAFAKARKIDLPLTVGACSTLSSCEKTYFSIETDLEFLTEELSLKLSIFPELTASSFKVKAHGLDPITFPMTTGYCLEIPMAGPWSEFSTDLLGADTLETWQSNNKDLLKAKLIRIKIYSQNHDLFHEIYPNYNPALFLIEFSEKIDFTTLSDDLLVNEVELIFYDLECDQESGQNIEHLSELISAISSLPHIKPIIVSTQNPSKTQAIQKLFNYSNIICTDKALSAEMYLSLTNNYLGKRKSEDKYKYQFQSTTEKRPLDVNFEVTLTSLTEHEITFYSEIELPMFTLLHLILPIDLIATVVPSIIDLPNRAESKHYMAFLSGLDEIGAAALRKFVNQIIYKPLENYLPITIAQAHSNMMPGKIRYDVNPCEMPVNRFERTNNENISETKTERRFTGKSKL
jgi:hypothetical protein